MYLNKNFILLLSVVIPSALSLWLFNIMLRTIFGITNVSLLRWTCSVLIPILFALWGLRKNSLSISGAIAGFFVGFVITLSNFLFLSCLMVFFVSSSKATKFRSNLKRKFEENFVEGGKRNWLQVFCNGIVGAMIAFVYILDCGCREQPIDFVQNYRCSIIASAFLGSFCCSNGDTWASELGPVLPLGKPFLITTFKAVPKGTNGGVSVAGLIASAFGGGAIGSSFYITLRLFVSKNMLSFAPTQSRIVLVAMLAGFIGSLIDSLLGATLQYSGVNKTGIVVEHPGPGIKRISGIHFLDNHAVNLISCILTALITPVIGLYML